MLRETLGRYGQTKLGFIWALLEPIIWITVFVGIAIAIRSRNPGGIPLVLFMVTGFVPFLMFRNSMNQMQGAIASNRNLIGFPQVTSFDVIIARGMLEWAISFVVFPTILIMVHVFLGHEIRVENPLGVFAVFGLLMMLGAGLGFLFAALSPIWPSSRQFTSVVLGRPLLLSSGLFFTADSLPTQLRDILLWNPILHMMELLRSEFFVEFDTKYGEWSYALSWSVGALAFGLLVHQALRRRAIVGL